MSKSKLKEEKSAKKRIKSLKRTIKKAVEEVKINSGFSSGIFLTPGEEKSLLIGLPHFNNYC